MVLAIGPQAQHGVVSFVDFFQEQGDVGGVVLQVAVHGDEDVAGGEVDAGLEGGGLAEVAAQANHLDARVAPGQPPVDVHTNAKGLLGWFTPEHIGGLIALFLVVVFVRVFWKMITGHPVIFAILVIFGLLVAGVLTFGHIPSSGGHPFGPPR